jgi:site-specific DNA recombinase
MSIRPAPAQLQPPLQPRRGNFLRVMGVARISTVNQDEKSLDDQEALYRQWLDLNYGDAYTLEMLATQASGERVDREELGRLDAAIDSQTYDLVLAEDLGRIARRVHAVLICESCVDASTRLIAINDSIDTAREDGQLHSFFATFRHESYNRDTGRRIRRSQRNRFLQGGVLKSPPFCYSKPIAAKHDSELQIIPEMVPVVKELFRRL